LRVRLHRARRRLERAMSRVAGPEAEGSDSDHWTPSAALASSHFSGTQKVQPQVARIASRGAGGTSRHAEKGTNP
jgi:hypothetical protein